MCNSALFSTTLNVTPTHFNYCSFNVHPTRHFKMDISGNQLHRQ